MVVQSLSHVRLCNPMVCSMPGFPVLHSKERLPEFAQTHVHWVQWCHPTISSCVTPFSSCQQSFPSSRSFPMSQLLAGGSGGGPAQRARPGLEWPRVGGRRDLRTPQPSPQAPRARTHAQSRNRFISRTLLFFSMIQQMFAVWSLVSLPFLKPAWTSGISRFTYCWRG